MNNEEILLLVCIILAVLTIVISFYGCSFYVFEKFDDDDTEEALQDFADRKDHEDLWLGDSGASMHMGFCDKNMTNVPISHTNIKVGNGSITKATKTGDKTITVQQKDGLTMKIVLKD